MTRYVWHEGRWTPPHEVPAPRRFGEAPMLIRDGMDALVHPATGQTFESKSQFREVTRANGLTEVGNDTMGDTRQVRFERPTQHEIARAIDQLESR